MTALLDGEPLIAEIDGVPQPVRWDNVPGPVPYQTDVVVPVSLADKFMRNREPLGSTLVIAADQPKDRKTVEQVTILRKLPTDNPHYVRLRLADLRWQWEYRWFHRAYNVRVRGGNFGRFGDDPAAVQVRDADVLYQPWSLNGDVAWTPDAVLRDALDEIAPGWVDRDGVLGRDLAPVEGLEVSANQADALNEILAYFGALVSVYVDDKGTVKLILRTDDLEDPVQAGTATREDGALPQITPGPGMIVQDRALERPARVRVLFRPLIELRMDRVEGDDDDLGATSTSRAPKPRLDDIVELPEDATIDGEDVARGGYAKLDDYLGFLEGKAPGKLPDLSRAILRAEYLGSGLGAYVERGEEEDPWEERIAALRDGFRTRFQLRKAWRERIKVLQARRVGVVNRETGSRAPATVFVDQTHVPYARRSDSKRYTDPDKNHHVLRVAHANPSSGPNNIVGTPIGDLRKAPVEVRVVDQDQKVFRIDYRDEPSGNTRFTCPAVDEDNIPTHKLDSDLIALDQAPLAQNFELSVIMAAVMGAPNDNRIFWGVEVGPEDAREHLPKAQITPAEGPVLEVAVSAARVPARFGWDDEVADQVNEAFSEASAIAVQDVFEKPLNEDQLEAVAKAVAASVYLRLADRQVGGIRTGLRPDMELEGTASRVSWVADPILGPYSERIVPEEGPIENFETFLPADVRRAIDFMVDPEAGGGGA